MTQALFNPNPSALRTARMLSYRVPRPTTSFPGPSPSGHTKIGLRIPRLGRAGGGQIPDSPEQPFTGPIVSSGAGRADNVPMHVPPGAYVLPADVISHMGQGNSLAGMQIAHLMFGPKPFGAQSGPWGVPLGKPTMGKGVAMPKADLRPVRPMRMLRQPGSVAPTAAGPAGPTPQERQVDYLQKHGGSVPNEGLPGTPIAASGGEYVISPGEVKRRGGGDITKGHKILDAFVKAVRADHIKTLQKLPGPAQD
jgi:hypothetical protein